MCIRDSTTQTITQIISNLNYNKQYITQKTRDETTPDTDQNTIGTHRPVTDTLTHLLTLLTPPFSTYTQLCVCVWALAQHTCLNTQTQGGADHATALTPVASKNITLALLPATLARQLARQTPPVFPRKTVNNNWHASNLKARSHRLYWTSWQHQLPRILFVKFVENFSLNKILDSDYC